MMFVTLFFGILNPATGELAYCNAGHNPPYRIYDGVLSGLEEGKGIILGVRPQATYQTGTATLRSGETLYLFSDGVTEAHDTAGALFSEERLETHLRTTAGRCSDEIVEAISRALETFVGTAPPSDDITMLALRWGG
jgi:sigma-B regulation protein RsbU (phosphoserine phosphatase)